MCFSTFPFFGNCTTTFSFREMYSLYNGKEVIVMVLKNLYIALGIAGSFLSVVSCVLGGAYYGKNLCDVIDEARDKA